MAGRALRAGLFLAALCAVQWVLSEPVRAQGNFGVEDSANTERGKRRALLIGINSYEDPNLGSLRFARSDAEYLADVFADPVFGGFEVDLVVDGDLTNSALMERLRNWKEKLGPEDTALIYYSGHGMRWLDQRRRSQVFLAGSNSRKEAPLKTAIPLTAVVEFLESLPTPRRVLILDACFTGTGKILAEDVESLARSYEDGILPFDQRPSEHQAQLFATSYGRPALESRSLGHGLYTWHLGQALSARFDAADSNGDLVVSVSEAHDYARLRTLKESSGTQVPMAVYKVVGRETLLLAGQPGSRRRVAMAMVSAYSAPQQGLRMIVDGVERGAFPSTVLIDPGSYQLEFRNLSGRVVDRGRFTFGREKVYSVSSIRDRLNGGRHQLAVGYAHHWIPGAGFLSKELPEAGGLRIGYTFRFPSREPLLRRMGCAIDLDLAFLPEQESSRSDLAASPETVLLSLSIGPILRLDVPWLLLSVQPRVALVSLFRTEVEQPYLHWTYGAVGGNFAIGFRPLNRISVQVHYSPMLFNAPLAGGIVPRISLMQRLAGAIEVGF
jgi:hypothetical protein